MPIEKEFIYNQNLLEKVQNLTLSPGCYIYKDSKQTPLYIGKAKNIRKRVSQYFHRYERLQAKIQMMLTKAVDIEIIETDTEVDALVLEANLIRKYKPQYNASLKDDKRYILIQVENREDFPRINLVREKKRKSAHYYGPFPAGHTIRNLLKKLRHIVPYRDCNRKIYEKDGKVYSSDPKPCLYYHIGLCNAPCAGLVDSNTYKKNIQKIGNVFEGKTKKMIEELKVAMVENSKEMNYERAAIYRDRIKELQYISEISLLDYDMDEVELAEAKNTRIYTALNNLINKLEFTELKVTDGFKIECFDISNIQGKNAVASMVVFVDGKSKKSHYRKFSIKTKDTPDDFHMMQEVLTRRFRRIGTDDKSFGKAPDLIIVDGGKGQLSSAYEVLQKEGVALPLIGLAKREEEIFKIILDEDNNINFKRIKLPDRSAELFLIQRIRDEAHRFAITYHRNLRSKSQIITSLDSIPGIGEKTKRKLLQEYGSFEGIRKARKDDLASIIKNKTVFNELLKRL